MTNNERRRLEDKFFGYVDAREFHSEAECEGLFAGLMKEMDDIQDHAETGRIGDEQGKDYRGA
jgi:hypothetical protein